jgi:2EXR family
MLGIYNYLSTKLVRREASQAGAKSSQSELASFPLFSSLPAELRLKIWHLALPTRLIEASLDFQSMQFPLIFQYSADL